ncbi:MAG TPA: hypothetical protein VJ810_29620 [Blastocatellia bacterium]|nr:hypothetical protein [Blastocatellia bacterium]
MRKIFVVLFLTVLMAGAALADELYLKNGSMLRGRFVSYENGKFIFETGGNRLEFPPNQVSRLVVERRDDRYPPRGPRRDPSDRPSSPGGRGESAATLDVRLEEQWVRSQIRVERGDRVRVDASGTINLEGRTATGPEGLQGRRDKDSPMPQQNDGGLIAAIGQDQDIPSIFIGRSREFTAEQDGDLYFTVNHGETRDARGSFRVNVEVDRGRGGETGGGTRPGQRREKVVTINANEPWTDTGVIVEPNMTFDIVAEGTIEIGNRASSNPDGNRGAKINSSNYPMNNYGVGALIGKIRYRDGRDSNFVFIGAHGNPTTERNENGRLYLGINDDYFQDNSGSYRVTIRW